MMGAASFLLWQVHQFAYGGLLVRHLAEKALLEALEKMGEEPGKEREN